MSKFAAAIRNHAPQDSAVEDVPAASSKSGRPPGRPPGKRSAEGNTQVTAYVPAQLYDRVKIRLIQQGRGAGRARKDFSDLLREWMEAWLAE